MTPFTLQQVLFRLLLAVIIGGVIGMDREVKNRPAGLQTHIMVCLGACVISLIQVKLTSATIDFASANLRLEKIISTDQSRLIAQTVSGIGFLGAGTIIVNHHAVTGLTTAATLWTTGCLGIAIGMGYYMVAVPSAIGVLLVLVLLKKIVRFGPAGKITVRYAKRDETVDYIEQCFLEQNVHSEQISFTTNQEQRQVMYTNVYKIYPINKIKDSNLLNVISENENVYDVSLTDL